MQIYIAYTFCSLEALANGKFLIYILQLEHNFRIFPQKICFLVLLVEKN